MRVRLAIAAFMLATVPAAADDLISEGRTLAEENCARCHAIGAGDESAHEDAPAFRTLSAKYPVASLEEALAEGIVSGHPDMPELAFPPEQVAALIAYLESVQPH